MKLKKKLKLKEVLLQVEKRVSEVYLLVWVSVFFYQRSVHKLLSLFCSCHGALQCLRQVVSVAIESIWLPCLSFARFPRPPLWYYSPSSALTTATTTPSTTSTTTPKTRNLADKHSQAISVATRPGCCPIPCERLCIPKPRFNPTLPRIIASSASIILSTMIAPAKVEALRCLHTPPRSHLAMRNMCCAS